MSSKISALSALYSVAPDDQLTVVDTSDTTTNPHGAGGSNKRVPAGPFYQALGGAHSAKLLGWFAALAARGSRRVNVAVIGDSIVAGQGASSFAGSWPQLLATALNARFPTPGLSTHGRGFLAPIIPPSNPTSYTPSYVTVASQANLIAGSLYGYGPNLETWDISHTAANTLTYSLTGDSADILWAGASGNGTFSWKVDAGATTNVSTNVTFTPAGVTHVSLGTAGAHTLTITNVSGGPTYITGVIEYNGDFAKGIQVHGLGFSGSTTGYWTVAGGATSQADALAPLKPDLIVIALGVNDNASSISAATSASNLTTFISGARTALAAASLTVPPFLLLADYNAASDGPTTPAQWDAYVQQMYGIAAADSLVDVCDLTLRMPSTGATTTWGLYDVDGIHPAGSGHQLMADHACQFLSPA
jgi:lysophospholipase L1-like esterase